MIDRFQPQEHPRRRSMLSRRKKSRNMVTLSLGGKFRQAAQTSTLFNNETSHRCDAVQEHAGRGGRPVVFPGRFDQRIGERESELGLWRLGTPGNNDHSIDSTVSALLSTAAPHKSVSRALQYFTRNVGLS